MVSRTSVDMPGYDEFFLLGILLQEQNVNANRRYLIKCFIKCSINSNGENIPANVV